MGYPPKHPGMPPELLPSHENYVSWQKKADEFALYYLTVFRPKEECYYDGKITRLGYDWKTFCEWLEASENLPKLIDQFQIKQM